MIFVNNFILSQFLGLCSFFGVSTKTENALAMGGAVIFVMLLSSIICYFIYTYFMVPMGIAFAHIIAFILIIAFLVQFLEFFLKKYFPALYNALGIYLPLIVANCSVLGVVILGIQKNYTFAGTVVAGLTGGVGYAMALLIMSGIREKLEIMKVPRSFRGLPIAFIVAALMSFAFLGFVGMIK